MRTSRTYAGLGIFLLYCALLAVAGPAMFWSARLGRHLAPVRVHGFVGYFMSPSDGGGVSHVAVPLEDGSDLYLSGAEIPGVIAAGTTVEKRRWEWAFRFDGQPAEWPLEASHVALAVGGVVAFGVLAALLGRSRLAGTRMRALTWLRAPERVVALILPGAATLLIGVLVAFMRGDLDRVTAVAALGAVAVGGLGGTRGTWRRLRERAVLARARRLAAAQAGGVERALGPVRRVERDFFEIATGAGAIQADLSACERLGLGPAPHPPIAAGDRVEVIGLVDDVADPTAESLGRGGSLARRFRGSPGRSVLVVPAPAPDALPARAERPGQFATIEPQGN